MFFWSAGHLRSHPVCFLFVQCMICKVFKLRTPVTSLALLQEVVVITVMTDTSVINEVWYLTITNWPLSRQGPIPHFVPGSQVHALQWSLWASIFAAHPGNSLLLGTAGWCDVRVGYCSLYWTPEQPGMISPGSLKSCFLCGVCCPDSER